MYRAMRAGHRNEKRASSKEWPRTALDEVRATVVMKWEASRRTYESHPFAESEDVDVEREVEFER